jgi:hypothetical protein
VKKGLVVSCLALSLTGCGDGGERYKKEAESLRAEVTSSDKGLGGQQQD